MNKKITSLNQQLMHLKNGEKAITEAQRLFEHSWSTDAQRQLAKHKETIRELIGEYGLDGYEWMFSNDKGIL